MHVGTYSYVDGSDRFDAIEFVNYADGSRCIACNEPRCDMYVTNHGELDLIVQADSRYPVVQRPFIAVFHSLLTNWSFL